MKKILYLFVLIFGLAGTLSAKVTLPALVGDKMVLQQQTDVKIWGWSEPNATVKITTSWGSKGSVSNNRMPERLLERNIPHDYTERPGRHDWKI